MTNLDLSRIGASDVSVVLGLNAFTGPNVLVSRLRHGVEPPPSESLAQAGWWGSHDEEGIARAWLHRDGRPSEWLFKPESRLTPGREWQRYSLDFVTAVAQTTDNRITSPALDRSGQQILECKLREWKSFMAQGWGEEGTDQVPESILVQVIAQMEAVRADRDFWRGTDVPELDHVMVLVRIGAFSLRAYRVPWDEELGRLIVDRCEEFWRRYVIGHEAPPMDAYESTRALLEAKRNARKDDWLEPEETSELRVMIGELQRLKENASAAAKAVKLMENRIVEAIGDHTGVRGDWGKVTLRTEKGRVSMKAVVDELAGRLSLSPEELGQLKELHRGKPIQKMDARWTKTK